MPRTYDHLSFHHPNDIWWKVNKYETPDTYCLLGRSNLLSMKINVL